MDYRLLRLAPIAFLLLGVGFIITIIKAFALGDILETFVWCLMFIALIIGLLFLITWWENRPR